jgi:hypothetical protein
VVPSKHTVCWYTLYENYCIQTHPDGSVRKEIILEPGHDGHRMDIVFKVADHLDVAVTNPACVSNLRLGAHKKADAAAKAKERKKLIKYQDLAGLAAGEEGGMTPFVVESTGRLGPSALKFFKEIKTDMDTFHNFISTVSACCALYTSLMVANARRRLHEHESLTFFYWYLGTMHFTKGYNLNKKGVTVRFLPLPLPVPVVSSDEKIVYFYSKILRCQLGVQVLVLPTDIVLIN